MRRERNTENWSAAIETAFGAKPDSTYSWTAPQEMVGALEAFAGINHALLPSGGGMHGQSFALSREPDCVEMQVSDRGFYIFKPAILTFEYIEAAPGESYFLMDLAPLAPSGVYEVTTRGSEDLLELDFGEYRSRDVWDRGYLDHDEMGEEVPIPEYARLVARFFVGRVMIVAQQSAWNSIPSTYDGRHSHFDRSDLRRLVEGLAEED